MEVVLVFVVAVIGLMVVLGDTEAILTKVYSTKNSDLPAQVRVSGE